MKRSQRLAKKREPQLVEGPKHAMVLRGTKCSEPLQELLRDIGRLKAPLVKTLSKRNDIRPFEDASSIGFLAKKNDCALFAFGSHSKKRPHNLVLGRTFDGEVLDMVEFGLEGYQPLADVSGRTKQRGSKPLLVFNGDGWATEDAMGKLQDLLIDFFRGADVDSVALSGLDHVMQCALHNGRVHIRHFMTSFKKSGSRVPRVELEPMGPSMDLVVRRTQFASRELANLARKRPRELEEKKQKNVTRNAFGDKVGRVYVDKQDMQNMQVRRMPALRETAKETRAKRRDGKAAGAGPAPMEEDGDDAPAPAPAQEEPEQDEEAAAPKRRSKRARRA